MCSSWSSTISSTDLYLLCVCLCVEVDPTLKSLYQPNFSFVSRISARFLDLLIWVIWISAEFFYQSAKIKKRIGWGVCLTDSIIKVIRANWPDKLHDRIMYRFIDSTVKSFHWKLHHCSSLNNTFLISAVNKYLQTDINIYVYRVTSKRSLSVYFRNVKYFLLEGFMAYIAVLISTAYCI